jgi:hypothetical protein
MVGMEQTPVRRPPLVVAHATSLLAGVDFGDTGVGGFPLDGDLSLSTGDGQAWQGKASTSALEAVQGMWARRAHATRVTADEALAITRAVLDYDMSFLGLVIDWASARVEVLGDVAGVRVAAPVRSANLLDAGARRAMVRLEIVDGTVRHAEWVLTDGDGVQVLEREELDPQEHTSPSIDNMTWFCVESLGAGLKRRGLLPPSTWQMGYVHRLAPEPAGDWCAELRVWTVF